MGSSLGKLFTITSFGESHGQYVGVVIDGCPAGLAVSKVDIQAELDRRRPVAGTLATTRAEADKAEILSGIFGGRTTGAPICLLVRNKNTDSGVYEKMRFLPRPGHADFTAFMKYGGFNDYRGGGRFSGRITAGYVMAGAVAKKLLDTIGVSVIAHTVEIGGVKSGPVSLAQINKNTQSTMYCADTKAAGKMLQKIKEAKTVGDSVGGVVEGIALNVPVGLGEPVFDTLEGDLAKALFAIPAVKGVEFGAGFKAAGKKGSENNDAFVVKDDAIRTLTNNAGGISGGISNGMPLVVRVAVKPTPSITAKQQTVDLRNKTAAELEIKGRHDTCIVPRVVPVVEAMIAVTLCDFALRAGKLSGVIE